MTLPQPLVLLVEDDQDTAMLYQTLLRAEGLEVVRCRGCAEAKAWLASSRRVPDLIVLDMRLPDGDGLGLCQEMLQGEFPAGDPPVMVLSAHGDPRLPSRCRQAGAKAFVDKLAGVDLMVTTAKELLQAGSSSAHRA